MRIVKFIAENFKCLKAIEIKPDGNVVRITGRNGAGKSSVLDAICVALSGKTAAPKKPIRDGQEKAVIVVDMEDIVVTRKFTASGSYLEVTNKEGFKAPSPQAVLDKLIGAIAFDPLAFIAKNDREQRQVLIELMGVDLDLHDKKIVALQDHRKQLMAQKKTAELDLSRMPKNTDAPVEEVSMAALVTQLSKVNTANKEYDAQRDLADQQLRTLTDLQNQMQRLKTQLAVAEADVQRTQAALAGMKHIDTTEIEKQAETLEVTNKKVRENQAWGKAQAGINKLAEQVNADFQQIKQAETDKANALAGCLMPLPGLSVDETGVLYQGIPLSQVNHARQLEISLAIQMALNPKLRVMLINGNGLDKDTLASIAKLATDKDYQVWQEIASEDGKVGVLISDGQVVAVNGKPTKAQQVEQMLKE